MKRFFLVLCTTLLFVISCGSTQKDNKGKAKPYHAVVEFDSEKSTEMNSEVEVIDLGRIASGETIDYRFGVRNTDSTAMVILNVVTTCGCTSVDYDKHPIMPGDTASIDLLYDSSGQNGNQMKMIQVITSYNQRPLNIRLFAEVNGK